MRKVLVTVAILLTFATGYVYFQTYQNAYSQVGKIILDASKSNDAKEINELLQEAKENAQEIGINDAEFFSQIQIAINTANQSIDVAKIAINQIYDPTNAYIWSKYWWLFIANIFVWLFTKEGK